MRTCEILTDIGAAYVKCLGNPEGPHALACEWIGSRLAETMGLETLDFALLKLTDDDVPFTGGGEEAGSAFVSRAEDGFPWSGRASVLQRLCNPGDAAKLVALDFRPQHRRNHFRIARRLEGWTSRTAGGANFPPGQTGLLDAKSARSALACRRSANSSQRTGRSMRGYYSLVQFCPDSARAEAANVGVVVLCPDRHFIDCKFASSNDRVRRFFSVQGEQLERLDQIKEESRSESDLTGDEFGSSRSLSNSSRRAVTSFCSRRRET
jgi:hypothetical protein